MPASAAATVLAAGASITSSITLASAVTVLSTEDPVRVYQQFATLDAISNGRAEITAGRGSSIESFPLFGYDLRDYDDLYAEKLDLLLAIDRNERVTWQGRFRPALQDAEIVPRPDSGHLPIWLGTGGNPRSSLRAGQLGLPISYGIIGGQPHRFAQLAELYRRSARAAGTPSTRSRSRSEAPASSVRTARQPETSGGRRGTRAWRSSAAAAASPAATCLVRPGRLAAGSAVRRLPAGGRRTHRCPARFPRSHAALLPDGF